MAAMASTEIEKTVNVLAIMTTLVIHALFLKK